jgi:hypothetical protein
MMKAARQQQQHSSHVQLQAYATSSVSQQGHLGHSCMLPTSAHAFSRLIAVLQSLTELLAVLQWPQHPLCPPPAALLPHQQQASTMGQGPEPPKAGPCFSLGALQEALAAEQLQHEEAQRDPAYCMEPCMINLPKTAEKVARYFKNKAAASDAGVAPAAASDAGVAPAAASPHPLPRTTPDVCLQESPAALSAAAAAVAPKARWITKPRPAAVQVCVCMCASSVQAAGCF